MNKSKSNICKEDFLGAFLVGALKQKTNNVIAKCCKEGQDFEQQLMSLESLQQHIMNSQGLMEKLEPLWRDHEGDSVPPEVEEILISYLRNSMRRP